MTTACPAAPAAAGTSWRVALGRGTGALGIDTVGDRFVVRYQGGRTFAVDVATGTRCTELVDATTIDPYTDRSAVVGALLVGPLKGTIGAIDLNTGARRWSRDLARGSKDEYSLRDKSQILGSPGGIVVGFTMQHQAGTSWRWEEAVVVLDPATGNERWRMVALGVPAGTPLHRYNDLHVAVAGDRVLVRTSGQLRAVDAATGAVRWATTWPPHPEIVGPRMPWMDTPWIAGDERFVALAFVDKVRIRDTHSGAPIGEVDVRGAPTALFVRGGIAVVALEVAPGTASVVAIDLASARQLWSRDAAYSVANLRVDDRVYLLDGNRRLWGLGLRDGAVGFGMPAPGHAFAVAAGPSGTRVVFGAEPIVAIDPPRGDPPPLGTFVRWQLESANGACRPRALAFVDGADRPVWTRELPARIRALGFNNTCADGEVAYYLRAPRSSSRVFYSVYGIEDTGAALVEADATGVLALRKSDGTIALDHAVKAKDLREALFFDDGTFTVNGLAGCTGRSHSANVFARCGDRLVYFNGTTALVIEIARLRVEATAEYQRNAHTRYIGRATSSIAKIPVGKYEFVLEGTTYMR